MPGYKGNEAATRGVLRAPIAYDTPRQTNSPPPPPGGG
jgi:hypothetical protein